MNDHRRLIACALVAGLFLGMLPSSALGQQPTAPASQPAAAEAMPPEGQAPRGADIYDIGAGVVTVARVPFNVALCGLGAATGTVLFLLTFGSAYRASTRVIEEGCAQRWIIRGDDLRPRAMPGILSDRSSEAYQNRR